MPRRAQGFLAWLLVSATAAAVWAQGSAGSPSGQAFDIPAEPLAQALTALGSKGRLDLAYENNVVTGRRSAPVHGVMTAQAAVDQVLKGTGLLYRFTSVSAVLIFPPDRLPEPDDAQASGGAPPRMMLGFIHVPPAVVIGAPPATYAPYGQDLRAHIDRVLSNDPKVGGRVYHAEVALRVDASGAIKSLVLVRSTGDSALDAAIRVALLGAPLGRPPPPDMPQPIWFELASQ